MNTCQKCSTDHDPNLCQGHVIKDPQTREPIPPRQCAKTPVKGSTVCRSHGAARGTPAAAAAEARRTEADAERVLAGLWRADAVPVTNAVLGLQRLTGQLQGAADFLGDKLEVEGMGNQVMTAAWLRVLRELRTALSEMERLGIAERAVEIEGARVRLMAHAVGRVLEQLGLDAGQRAEGVRLLLVELRSTPELSGPGSDGGEAA